ncbi:MAG: plastocyanin/azurin family copper-binding protein, partial [Nitrosopumilus sp.]|nr:plastocyanin/azurin family copper-binding protein [Nitrosopumilus sp.]
ATEVEATEVEATEVEATEVEATEVEATEVEATEVEATEVEATSMIISIPQGAGVTGCEINNECYLPYEVTIPVGTTVVWSNDDTAAHTVTSGIFADGFDGLFDSRMFTSGSTYEFTFNDSGTYDYFCLVHPWMVGIIHVGESQMTYEVETVSEAEVIPEIKTNTKVTTSTVSTTEMSLSISIPNGAGISNCETKDDCFSPHDIAIPVGATVTWNNDDIAAHTVTSGNINAGSTGVFDSRLFTFGSTFEFTFNDSGTYDYFCNVHPSMVGIIHVG